MPTPTFKVTSLKYGTYQLPLYKWPSLAEVLKVPVLPDQTELSVADETFELIRAWDEDEAASFNEVWLRFKPSFEISPEH